MPRPRNLTPTYTRHKQSGRGRLIWTDAAGVRHQKLLPGPYGSEESLAAKARLELELATSPTRSVPHLPHHIRVMVELMAYTGMRPSEVCAMTLARIDRGGDVWKFRPGKHKTAQHGKERVIPLGPNARTVLSTFLVGRELEPDEPIFSPRLAREERFARLRENRKSKVQPSQVSRKKASPPRLPGPQYTPNVIAHAVATAAEKAKVGHWHPYQLRHSYATKVRKHHGLEAAGRLTYAQRAWAIEEYHRGLKQYTEVERCPARLVCSQRNHIGLALRAFIRLEWHRYRSGVSWFEAKWGIIRDAVRAYLANPVYNFPQPATAQLLTRTKGKKPLRLTG